jgi:hypothetical protein
LDRRIEGEIELLQFGLMPEFIGQGLGRYFLQWAIDKAWSYQPRRYWLHTDTKDLNLGEDGTQAEVTDLLSKDIDHLAYSIFTRQSPERCGLIDEWH